MNWMITGAAGMLGTDLIERLLAGREEVSPFPREELDITDGAAVLSAVREAAPDVIVNCAAFTKVDECEEQEELATRINGAAVGHLAHAANEVDALLIQVSTDFVFDGSSERPYEVDDPVAPLSAYGRSKLEGERQAAAAAKHQIVRTSWLFGTAGWNFVEAIRRQIDTGREELRVVDDQRGGPTFTKHLADAIVRLGRLGAREETARGIFHYSDQPDVTWYGFAVAVAEEMQQSGALAREVRIHPVSSDEFPRPARRPAWSVLSTSRWEAVTGRTPADWRGGLREYLRP